MPFDCLPFFGQTVEWPKIQLAAKENLVQIFFVLNNFARNVSLLVYAKSQKGLLNPKTPVGPGVYSNLT